MMELEIKENICAQGKHNELTKNKGKPTKIN